MTRSLALVQAIVHNGYLWNGETGQDQSCAGRIIGILTLAGLWATLRGGLAQAPLMLSTAELDTLTEPLAVLSCGYVAESEKTYRGEDQILGIMRSMLEGEVVVLDKAYLNLSLEEGRQIWNSKSVLPLPGLEGAERLRYWSQEDVFLDNEAVWNIAEYFQLQRVMIDLEQKGMLTPAECRLIRKLGPSRGYYFRMGRPCGHGEVRPLSLQI